MTKRQFAMALVCAICFAALLLVSSVPEARAFDEPNLLARQIRPIAIKGETIDQVLGTLTTDYRIPIGIELGDEKLTPLRKIDLNLPETNLKDFLDAVIAKDPRYTWKLEGGVIHSTFNGTRRSTNHSAGYQDLPLCVYRGSHSIRSL